jgi:glucose-1-phosphate adenylyltransferase
VLAGDHLYRMDYLDLVDAHIDRRADITIAAQPVSLEDASGMGILRLDRDGQIAAFEEKPTRERLGEMPKKGQTPGLAAMPQDKPFMASMGIYVFSRDVLLDCIAQDGATDFGKQIIPNALSRHRVHAHLFRGYWADVGTVRAFYDANVMLTNANAPFTFYDSRRPMYTHPRFLPGARFNDCTVRDSIINEGSHIDRARIEQSVVGIRTTIRSGASISRSVLLGADYYEADDNAPARGNNPGLGVGSNVVLDRVIMDKNARIGDGARLVNEQGVDHADGDGYYIRDGIIVVPKDGVIQPGTVV